jgi:RNA polymerase sigma-70 factor (ECF subfamily)
MSIEDDSALVGRARLGDGSAFTALVQKHLRSAIAVGIAVLHDPTEAEDLAQEAFVRAFQSIGRFRAGEQFGPWVARIVTNAALDVLKHRRKFRHEELGDTAPAPRRDGAELPAMSGEIARRIDLALEELPEMQRIVARLHLIEELEHAEIASITGVSEGTVRSHLSLARTKLKVTLADLYE